MLGSVSVHKLERDVRKIGDLARVLTEGTSVSSLAEVDLTWNWCVILIDAAMFNWAK